MRTTMTIALYRCGNQTVVLPYIENAKAYGGICITEPVEVDFTEIAVDPKEALDALAQEEAAAIAQHERMLADIAARRAKVSP